MSYFKSLLAELMPGWAFWRWSRRPTPPLAGSPLNENASKRLAEKKAGGAEAEKGPARAEPDLFEDRK